MKKLLYLLAGLLLLFSCKQDDNFVPFASVTQYSFSDTTHFLANDSSKITVTVSDKLTKDGNFYTVAYPAAGGQLLNADASGKVYILKNQASFTLLSGNTPGTYLLTCQFGTSAGSLVQFIIHAKPALPDLIQAETATSFLDTASTAKVFTLTLKRNTGVVSLGTGVNAFAYQLNSKADTVKVGRFTGLAGAASNAAGQVTLNYYSDTGGFDKTAPVYLKFYCSSNAGKEVKTVYTLKFR
ncbi:MAG: hypothetical protein V4577_04450 [Bacteroidota bacterium]